MLAAPVQFCKKNIENGSARGLVVNAGIANSYTGKKGIANTKSMAITSAKILNCRQKDLYICSTGVIGEQIQIGKTLKAIKRSFKGRSRNFKSAAKL